MNTGKMKVGFIGLGKMGYPMAGRLHRAGFHITVYDIDQGPVGRFVGEYSGAIVARNFNDFSEVEAVITMLPDSDSVEAALLGHEKKPGLTDFLRGGATVIDMSSSQPLRSRSLADVLGKGGLNFLDAPVSGGVKGAVCGSLTIMVGGGEKQFQKHRGLFDCMGRTVVHVGGPGAGHALKALNNYVSAAGIVAAVEALHVGQEFGLDPEVMTDVLNTSTGQNYATTNKVKQYMLSGAFNSGFALQLMKKDLNTAVELGESLGCPSWLSRDLLQVWMGAGEELDMSADHTEIYRFMLKNKTRLRL